MLVQLISLVAVLGTTVADPIAPLDDCNYFSSEISTPNGPYYITINRIPECNIQQEELSVAQNRIFVTLTQNLMTSRDNISFLINSQRFYWSDQTAVGSVASPEHGLMSFISDSGATQDISREVMKLKVETECVYESDVQAISNRPHQYLGLFLYGGCESINHTVNVLPPPGYPFFGTLKSNKMTEGDFIRFEIPNKEYVIWDKSTPIDSIIHPSASNIWFGNHQDDLIASSRQLAEIKVESVCEYFNVITVQRNVKYSYKKKLTEGCLKTKHTFYVTTAPEYTPVVKLTENLMLSYDNIKMGVYSSLPDSAVDYVVWGMYAPLSTSVVLADKFIEYNNFFHGSPETRRTVFVFEFGAVRRDSLTSATQAEDQ